LARGQIPSIIKPMNNDITIPDLLGEDTRARKQIPIAIFTVIAIHVLLFLALLGAAGCKPKGHADADKLKSSENKKTSSGVSTAVNTPTPVTKPDELQCEPVHDIPAPAPAAHPAKSGKGMKKQGDVMASSEASDISTADGKVHVVQPGDSLFKIAKTYNTTAKALKTSNNLKSDRIRVGQKLRIG
jgi:LysM repeat protein